MALIKIFVCIGITLCIVNLLWMGRVKKRSVPVRVFRQQLLESTPDVRYYSIKQHPWCDRDTDRGDLTLVALPVFDPSGKCCAGVLELVSPSCEYEFDAVCKALEAVDLKGLGQSCNHFDKKIRNEALQLALDEITKVLEVVCETHKLPLAQTWVPYKQCNYEAISGFRNKSPRYRTNSLSNMEPACSNMPRGQAMATAAHMMPHVTTMQDVKTVDIKAAYKGTLIRFKLPPTAGMVNLEEEIVKRLTFLQVGRFKVTYLDEDNDSILLACDADLQNYINTAIASGITKIRMFIEPETNRQP
ncbi:hypothetical protein F0562_025835 [Nyssa sinensis]|uniref:PB1 domain-containing protein n=1 Tax=Nyssa sinensis TaxID=561372 RepID=A0A5J5B7E5_9ASTE|nr:hypothetical protein F0562_025835 [Nyssa sinensis]